MTTTSTPATRTAGDATTNRARLARVPQVVRVTAILALVYAILHAFALSEGGSIPLYASFARTTLNAILWFVITPAMLGLIRRRTHGLSRVASQAIVIISVTVAYGVLQADAASRLGIRDPVPALAGVFYYLDVNLAASLLAALVLELLAQNRALVSRDRWLLALDARLSEARGRFLALQLQPHFLFNALNMVVALAADAPSGAAQMLRNLRTLLVATAGRSRMPWIPLHEELGVLEAYLAILEARHADALRVERAIDPRAADACVPPLMLQPLVENAIRHALVAGDATALVRLEIGMDADDRVRIALSNSYRSPASSASGLGIGLRNTRERLARFFRDDYSMTLSYGLDRALLTVIVPHRTREGMRSSAAFSVGAEPSGVDVDMPPSLQTRLARIVASPRPWLIAVATVLFWTFAWVFWACQMYFYSVVRGWKMESVFEGSWGDMVSAMTWIALTPVVLALGTYIPIRGPRWLLRASAHVVLSFGISLLQLRVIMASGQLGSRTLFHQANFNQLALNCVIYFLLIALTSHRTAFRWFQERHTAERRLEAALAQARWHALAMEAQPALIATALERIAAIMDTDPDLAEDEVLELADALRLLLQSSESESVGPRDALETLQAVLSLRRSARGIAPHIIVSSSIDEAIRVTPSELIAQTHAMIVLPGVDEVVVDSTQDAEHGPRLRISAQPNGASFLVGAVARSGMHTRLAESG